MKPDGKKAFVGILLVLGLCVGLGLVSARSGGEKANKRGIEVPDTTPRASNTTTPATTYRGYAYWHHNDGFFEYDDTAMNIGHDFDFWNEEWRGYTEWDISAVPDSAIVTYVGIQLTVSGSPAACEWQYAEVCFYAMANRPSVAGPSAQTLFNDAGDGTQYCYGNSSSLSASGTAPFIKLGQDAVNALSAARTSDWFAVGFIDFFDGGTENWDDEGLIFSSAALKVIYYEDGDDAHEENDGPLNAKNLAVGTYADLRCFDADYFAVNIPKENHTQNLRVLVTSDASVGELRVDLYDRSGTRVANQSSANELQVEFCVAETNNGTYTFAITGVNGEHNLYSLTIELVPDCLLVVDPWVIVGIIAGVIVLLAAVGGLVKAWQAKKSQVPSPKKPLVASPSVASPVPVIPPQSQGQSTMAQPVSPPNVGTPPATPLPKFGLPPVPEQGADTDFLEEVTTSGRFCHHCGAELGPAATFCKRCGLNL